MSKTLLLIAAHPGAGPTLSRHWPYLKGAGVDIAGASTENKCSLWPEPVHMIDLGHENGRGGDNLVKNFLRQVAAFLTMPQLSHYTDLCIIEYDCLFIKPLPKFEGGFWSHLAGGPYPNLKANQFYHPPWWMSRDMARIVVKSGEEMIRDGDVEKGFTDFFIGRMQDRYGIPIRHLQGIYSRNTMENPTDIIQCRDLIREGRILMVHGVKTQDQLNQLLA